MNGTGEQFSGANQDAENASESGNVDHSVDSRSQSDGFEETVKYRGEEAEAVPADEVSASTGVPQRVGRYEIREVLGEGGFGAVYSGFDSQLNRRVAIKVPHVHLDSQQVEQEFIKEARQLAQLKHPGIVTVFDVGVDDGRCFIVSDFLEGVTLQNWLKQARPAWPESARIVAEIADALAHAHANRTVHRDLKPGNVILVQGPQTMQPVLVDFGLAVSDSQKAAGTGVGEVSGTPNYMSPEQVKGEGHRIDGRTDIYALGVLLYRMLTGRLPFASKHLTELMRQVREDEPQPPRQVAQDIPPQLEYICLKSMAKNLGGRYTTAGDMAVDLRQVIASVTMPGMGYTAFPQSGTIPPQNMSGMQYPGLYPGMMPPSGVDPQTGMPQSGVSYPGVPRPGMPVQPQSGTQQPGLPGNAAPMPGQPGMQVGQPGMSPVQPTPTFQPVPQPPFQVVPPAETPAVQPTSTGQAEFSGEYLSSITRRGAERRRVTVVQCGSNLYESEEIQATLDPDEQSELLEEYQHLCRTVCREFGGTVVQDVDTGLLICFGYPVTYEDAVQRAIRTARKIVDELKRFNERQQKQRNVALSAQISVHSDFAVLEEKGQSGDTLSLVGPIRHVVSNLEGIGQTNTVVISEATHKLVKGFFDCTSLGKQQIKGVAGGMEVFAVNSERAVRTRIEATDANELTPLVGRDREVGLMQERWEQAVEGMGQVVVLIGEAGLGKSRLVHALKRHVSEGIDKDGTPVIEWRTTPHHQASSLHPAHEYFERALAFEREQSDEEKLDVLEDYLRERNLDGEEEVSLFASLLSIEFEDRYALLEMSPQMQKQKTFELLLDWLKECSYKQPVLFIVEDLHWIDPTSLEFVEMLLDQGLNDRMLTLLTFRPEFETPWKSKAHQTSVALNRLTKRQISEMMALRSGVEDLAHEVVNQVIDRTDGVPLFVEEFTNMLIESGTIDRIQNRDADTSETFSIEIPGSLQDLLMARLDRMASNLEVVQMGATVGREFSFELMKAVSPLTEDVLQQELTKLVEAELIFERGRGKRARYQFKHALIQDAAYGSLVRKKRQQFHNQIAEVLEAKFDETREKQPELLAHHFTAADETQKGIEYWLKAGQRAQVRSANTEAISHLTRGLDILKRLDQTPQRDQLELGLQATLGVVLMAARGWAAPEVGTAIERAQQLCVKIGTIADQFFVMWGHWGWRVIRADLDICDGISGDIIRLVEDSPDDHELLSEAYWVPGCTAYYKGEFKSSLQHLQKGLALVDNDRSRANSLRTGQNCGVMYRNHIALALWELGFPVQALQEAEEMLQFARELNHPFSLAMALFFRRRLLQCCGRDAQARESVEEEYTLCHEQGFVFFEVHAIFARGDFLVREGKLDAARKLFEQALRMLQATGGKLSMDHPFGYIAEGYILSGHANEANEWLSRGFDLVENHNYRSMESESLRLNGKQALSGGNEVDAERYFQQAAQVAQNQQSKSRELRAMISLAGLRQIQGRQTEGRQMLSEVFGWFQEGFDTADLIQAKKLLDDLAG